MELATALIWTLRIVLPIILFWIYFKLQTPKDEQWAGGASTGPSYARSQLLAHRKAIAAKFDEKPESLANLSLVDEAKAPALFVTTGRPQRGGGGGGRKERDAATRERRDKRENRKADKPKEAQEEAPAVGSTLAPAVDGEVAQESDKMHLESLLNYVAFNRKEQQRTFHIDEEGAPPPPPPKPPKKAAAPAAPVEPVMAKMPEAITISTATAEKANAEAQMVLKGAINFKRADVAKDLYEQLADKDVEISESTFTLMIEACILAKDLKHASDFLMKMEAKGYCPDMDLLDKVMDLYNVQKTQREQEKQMSKNSGLMSGTDVGTPWVQPLGVSADEVLDVIRPKLSSAAPIYMPLATGDISANEAEQNPASAASSPGVVEKTPLSLPHRTALNARAPLFQPKEDLTFDPSTYTWTMNESEENSAQTEGKGKTGKTKGKKGEGKGSDAENQKGKGKGRAKVEQKSDVKAEGVAEKKGSKKIGKEWKVKEAS